MVQTTTMQQMIIAHIPIMLANLAVLLVCLWGFRGILKSMTVFHKKTDESLQKLLDDKEPK